MKIDVDLSGIFSDEEGTALNSVFAERVETAIVESASELVEKLVRDKFEREIGKQIGEVVKKCLEDLVLKIIDEQYVPTNEWGYREEQITIRNRICKDVERAMKWKDGSYGGGSDIYNKILKETVSEKLKEFSREFTKTVDEMFIAACMEHAVEKIKRMTKVTG